MGHILGVHFKDFQKLCKNHRIYYYKGEGFYDLHFISDGLIVKTTILESQITNPAQFFADKMFYGAIQLTFQLPDPDYDAVVKVEGVKMPLESPIKIKENLPEEVKRTNIQREGVEEE